MNLREIEFKAEMKQLLNLIVHSLYTHPEVFLRELVSNSSDALNKLRFERLTNFEIYQPERELQIKISLDKENATFTLEDSGIGMTEDEVINQIGTVASSGTLNYLNMLKEQKKSPDSNLIGQFGVGFYSVFMVTDEVTLETKSSKPEAKAVKWVSKGEDKFSLEDSDRTERGTKITFKLKEEFKEFAEEYKIKSLLKKYSNFVDFEIFVNHDKVNSVQAIWHKKKEDVYEEELNDFFKFISNDFENPLGHLHLNIEGNINFKALLFIPNTAENYMMREMSSKTLHLYSNRVFISDEITDILPDYLKFVKGVVDTEDLPLNVSREVIQSSPATVKIKQILTTRILQYLEEISMNDKTTYDEFFSKFGILFKMGVTSDFQNKDKIVELLRFGSSHVEKNQLTGFTEYVARMKPDQNEIFYTTGDNYDSVHRNPNLEYFRKNDLEVIYLTEPIDLFIFPYIFEFDKKQVVSIEKHEIKKEDEVNTPDTSDKVNELISRFKEVLGDNVEDVRISYRLVSSPITLVAGEQGMDAQTEKMMKMLDKDFIGSKKVLEINPEHELIKYLSDTLHTIFMNQTCYHPDN
jgi:molecular chaperone HtpG